MVGTKAALGTNSRFTGFHPDDTEKYQTVTDLFTIKKPVISVKYSIIK